MQRMRGYDGRGRGTSNIMKKYLVIMVLFVALTLASCSDANTGRSIIASMDDLQEYTEIYGEYLKDYTIRSPNDTIYAEVEHGNAVLCYDVQAVVALEKEIAKYWYPHILSTMVIVVDRSKTDVTIEGWQSILEADVPVSIKNDNTITNMMILGSLAYGLNQKEPSKIDALNFLEQLAKDGRLRIQDEEAPIIICLDHEVTSWNKNGKNYEIIIPEEGTLSFQIGLLSNLPLSISEGLNDALLSFGLPLTYGNRPDVLPKDYHLAHVLNENDYKWFLEIGKDSERDMRRDVFHTRLFTSADHLEHILFALIVIAGILFWKGSVFHRIVRQDIRQVIGVLCWLMIGWLMLRLFKYQLLSDNILSRYCWYGYYIFQLALPLTFFWLTEIIDKAYKEKTKSYILKLFLVIYIFQVALVMTNDLHQSVFVFDLNGNWSNDYHYGIAYWFILAISIFIFMFAIINLFRKGRMKRNNVTKFLPLLVFGLMIIYMVAYIYRIPMVWQSDITIFICIISILFFESLLHNGLISVNIQYRRLFAYAPIKMTLLDRNGCTMLSSKETSPISRSIWKHLCLDMNRSLLRDNDTLLHAISIHGGMAVWQEDLSALNQIHKEMQDVQERLKAANEILYEEETVKKRLLQAEAKRKLFENLDTDMKSRIVLLADLIENLLKKENANDYISYITLCLCHIKRRCNLFFLAYQEETFMLDELSVYFYELVEIARYARLKILIRCGQRETSIDIRFAILCYDFAFEVISWALNDMTSTLMGYLENEGDKMVFRFLPSNDPSKWYFSNELLTGIAALNGEIVCKDLDDAFGICMILPLVGDVYE